MVEIDTTSRHPVPFPPLEFSAQRGKIHLNGQPVSLRGINWFGFELVDNHPHALWANSLEAYVDIIKHNGFNAVRLTMSAETMLNLDSAKPLNINKDLNPALGGPNVTAGTVLDALVDTCRQANILIMLNMHRMTPGGEITELWYTDEWPESRVIQAWRAVVARYKNHPHVFAMDLKNEPHGRAAWGGGSYSTDWAAAAERIGNAILADNPELLIFVAGVTYRFDQGIWGDDVGGAQARPINLSVPDRVPAVTHHVYDGAHCGTRTAAFALRMALSIQKHANLSEQFVQTLGALRRTRTDLSRALSMQSLTEMAAGAAHELNTPLAVISGRAQLLMETEDDDSRKQMLKQIQQRTEEISQIITDLMHFAKPATPDKRRVTLEELIGKAIEKTCQRHSFATLETELEVDQGEAVYVDVHQAAEAMAHLFSNAVQSYPGGNGPIWIGSQSQDGDAAVVLTIRDKGCGMDAATLKKATEPFFSHRPAGRRRGMGLSHAQRLLQLNDGSLRLESTPDQGTTVFVRLPKA